MSHSIRRRLLLSLLTITTLVWLVTTVSSYYETRSEVEELFDATLAESAHTLLTVAGHELAELEGIPDSAHIHFLAQKAFEEGEKTYRYEHLLAYQLWIQPQNRLILRSISAPERPLSTRQSGYSTELIDGQQWRVFSLYDPKSGFQIKMGESLAIRKELSDEITLRLALPILFALPLLALFIFLGIGRGLTPLKRLAETVGRRAPENLEPLALEDAPAEIHPLIEALNRLFARLNRAFDNERRFTADAAHELRTPLAALKIQAQVAKRAATAEERNRALEQLLTGIDRSGRLVEQLLTLARVDQQGLTMQPLALDTLAAEMLADLQGSAAAKGITLGLDAEAGTITGHSESLRLLLRNLIDNAIRYTPEKGEVRVSVAMEKGGAVLRVEDSGPGIDEAERQQVFERFYRLAGQESSGSGLGLSIVQRIGELHGAVIALDRSPLGGLLVTVRFPPAATP